MCNQPFSLLKPLQKGQSGARSSHLRRVLIETIKVQPDACSSRVCKVWGRVLNETIFNLNRMCICKIKNKINTITVY
jgi:hypothetical protein